MWRQVILQEGLVDGGRDLLDPRRSWPQLHPVTTDRHQDARYDVFLGSVTSPASSEAQAGQELRHAPEGPIRQLVDVDRVRVVDKVPEIMLVVEGPAPPQAPGPPAGNHRRGITCEWSLHSAGQTASCSYSRFFAFRILTGDELLPIVIFKVANGHGPDRIVFQAQRDFALSLTKSLKRQQRGGITMVQG